MILELFKKKEIKPQTRALTKQNVINFMRNLGIDVKTNTKARGNNGIYFKNRIDVANSLSDDKAIEVLVHEFAHYVHSRIDPDFNKTGGSLEVLFNSKDIKDIRQELVKVTQIIDKNDKSEIFIKARKETSENIKNMQKEIQKDYPLFKRSQKFREFEGYIKHSDAKYLVKYDAVKIKKGWLFKQDKIYTVKNIEEDFPQMPRAFQTYIKLCSMQRKQSRISRRINKMNKYFEKPTELFARFVQGYFFYPDKIKIIAPISAKKFDNLLNSGYYKELKNFFEIFAN